MDFATADSINNNWNVGVDFNFNPQVFAVTELPQGPAVDMIDTGALSGKPEESVPTELSGEKKESVPAIEAVPAAPKEEPKFVSREDVELDESDPAFALFASAPSIPKHSEPVYQIFGNVEFDKAIERFDLVIEDEHRSNDGVVSASTMARFERLCTSLDSASSRLESLMGRS